MIGGDGQTYEIRGWDHENGLDYLPKRSSIVIGFIGKCLKIISIIWSNKFRNLCLGNYNIYSPTERQFKNAYSLIEEMRRRQFIHNEFRVLGFQNISNSFQEGREILREINKWKRFSTTLKMLW